MINTFALGYGSDINCFTGVTVPCSSNGVLIPSCTLAMTAAISMRFPLRGSVYLAFWNILMANSWRCCPESFRTFGGGPVSSTRRNLLHPCLTAHRLPQLVRRGECAVRHFYIMGQPRACEAEHLVRAARSVTRP